MPARTEHAKCEETEGCACCHVLHPSPVLPTHQLRSLRRTQLGGDGAQFSRFKAESGLFMRGELTPEQYHNSIVSLGLLPVVSALPVVRLLHVR